MKTIFYTAILLSLVFCNNSVYAQQKHIVLKIEGVPGESRVIQHEDEIDITAFEQMSSTCSDPTSSCRTTLGNFILQKKLDISSNLLRKNLFLGRPYPEVTIAYTKDIAEGGTSDYYVIVLENAMVTSYKEVYSSVIFREEF